MTESPEELPPPVEMITVSLGAVSVTLRSDSPTGQVIAAALLELLSDPEQNRR